jgi:hypothetical protein
LAFVDVASEDAACGPPAAAARAVADATEPPPGRYHEELPAAWPSALVKRLPPDLRVTVAKRSGSHPLLFRFLDGLRRKSSVERDDSHLAGS